MKSITIPEFPASAATALAAESERVERDILTPREIARRRVLIVGGAGYIGSVLTNALLQAGYAVRCLDLLLYNNETTVMPYLSDSSYEFVFGDLAKPEKTDRLLDDVTDVIIMGALVGDPITKQYPTESEAINQTGTIKLLDHLAGRGLNKVVFVSTCSNYGLIEGGAVAAEDFPLNPLSIYAKTKVAVEQALLARKGQVDFNGVVLRFATAFGLSPRMRFDLTISEFTRDLYLGRELLVYDADTWRPYCHVRDFADAIQRVLVAPAADVAFEVFNAGGDENNHTKRSIVETIQSFIPDANVRYQEHGSDPRNYRVDFSKIRRQLHFTPRYTVPDGVRELIAALDRHLFDNVESRRPFYMNTEITY